MYCHYLYVQVRNIRRTLDQQDDDRQHARPLIHFAAAALTLFLHLLEVRNHDAHQLNDDRSGDVRHHSECKNRRIAECTAGEYVQQAQKTVALQLTGKKQCPADGIKGLLAVIVPAFGLVRFWERDAKFFQRLLLLGTQFPVAVLTMLHDSTIS